MPHQCVLLNKSLFPREITLALFKEASCYNSQFNCEFSVLFLLPPPFFLIDLLSTSELGSQKGKTVDMKRTHGGALAGNRVGGRSAVGSAPAVDNSQEKGSSLAQDREQTWAKKRAILRP